MRLAFALVAALLIASASLHGAELAQARKARADASAAFFESAQEAVLEAAVRFGETAHRAKLARTVAHSAASDMADVFARLDAVPIGMGYESALREEIARALPADLSQYAWTIPIEPLVEAWIERAIRLVPSLLENAPDGMVPACGGILDGMTHAHTAPLFADLVADALTDPTRAVTTFADKLDQVQGSPIPHGSCAGAVILLVLIVPIILVLLVVFLPILIVGLVLTTLLWQKDENADRIGDLYSDIHELANRTGDLDHDGADTPTEYRWGTNPVPGIFVNGTLVSYNNGKDFDSDGWEDGPEITYWDATREGEAFYEAAEAFGAAARDPDAGSDVDLDGTANVHDFDSDDDGIPDGNETLTYGSYPEFPDSDCSPEAETCTLVSATTYGDVDRKGSPGTGDGMSDADEVAYWESLLGERGWAGDCDGDGIANLLDADSDGDGILDGNETNPAEALPSNPCFPDADRDGLYDGVERTLGTDPTYWDSDRDQMPDGWEYEHGLNPLLDDAYEDADHDALPFGLQNIQEYQYRRPETWSESKLGAWPHGTNPRDWDTDGDRIDDYVESKIGVLNATIPEDANDADSDGLLNLAEYLLKTDILDPDTDDDGIPDGEEMAGGNPPALPPVPERVATPDIGLLPPQEVAPPVSPTGTASAATQSAPTTLFQSDPRLIDTDDDGMNDGDEAAYWAGDLFTDFDADAGPVGALNDDPVPLRLLASNLRDADADNDRLDDGQEVNVYGTDPRTEDTDGDGAWDYNEIILCHSSPVDAASTCASTIDPRIDADGDGLSDVDEIAIHGTNPLDVDTDDDALDDGTEVLAWKLQSGETRLHTDFDGDGPFFGGRATNLLDADADNDGIVDGVEFATAVFPRQLFYVTSPDDADMDNDGILDGDESHNDMVGEAAACAAQDSSLALTFLDAWRSHATSFLTTPRPGTPPLWVYDAAERCLKITGAWGITLYGARVVEAMTGSGSTTSPGAYWNDPAYVTDPCNYSANHQTNSDGDRLARDGTDEREWAHSCTGMADGDEDGISDHQETQEAWARSQDRGEASEVSAASTTSDWWDTDGDGRADSQSTDSDGDGRLDSEEINPRLGPLTERLDGDTDDDGLIDGNERGASEGETNATMADSDSDGLPDGLELGLTTPQTTTGSVDWTLRSRTFGCGSTILHKTWMPSLSGHELNGNLRDFDSDGLLDGLEDWNANGVVDSDETTPWHADTDGDRLADGLELRIWEMRDFCNVLGAYGDDLVQLRTQGLMPDPQQPLETSPYFGGLDFDEDGVWDGTDLSPNGIALVGFDMGPYAQLDPIDGWDCQSDGAIEFPFIEPAGPYPPCENWQFAVDPALRISVKAAGQLLGVFETPQLAEDLPARADVAIGQLLSEKLSESQNPLWGGHQLISAGSRMFQVRIPDSISFYKQFSDSEGLVDVDILLRDIDYGPDDTVDLDSTSGRGAAKLRIVLSATNRTELLEDVGDADGTSDGTQDQDDDDARLKLKRVNLIGSEIWGRAGQALSGLVSPPEGSSCDGMKGSAGICSFGFR